MKWDNLLFRAGIGLGSGVFICGMCYFLWSATGMTRWTFFREDGKLVERGIGKPKSACWPQERLGWQDAIAGRTGTVFVSRRGKILETIEYLNGVEKGAYIRWDGRGHPQTFQWDDGEMRITVNVEDGLSVSWSAGGEKQHEVHWRRDGSKHVELQTGRESGSRLRKRWNRLGVLVEDAEERDGKIWNGVETIQGQRVGEKDEVMGVFEGGNLKWRGERRGRSAAELKMLGNELREPGDRPIDGDKTEKDETP